MAEVSAAWAAPSAPAPAPPVPAAAPGTGSTAPDATGARRLEGVRPIPLRPLGVLELLDGAVGAVRALRTGLVARASAVAGVCALVGLGVLWAFDAAMKSAIGIHPLITTDYFGLTTVQYGQTSTDAVFGAFAVSVLIPTVFCGFAATVVAGLLSRPVREYIDGNRSNGSNSGNGQGTNGARPATPSIPRLCVLAAITAIPRVIFTGLFVVLALAAANDPSGSYAGIYTLLIVVGVPLCFWFTAQFAVAAPASVLEGLGPASALRRGGKLVSAGRWRVLWASLLTLAITTAVTLSLIVLQYSIYDDHGISDLLNGDPVNSSTYWWLAADVVVAALFSALTVPFRAAVAALLYVDRRFRREGLDIRIAWARVARANGGGKGR